MDTELDALRAVSVYLVGLRDWLNAHGISDTPNPLPGRWLLDTPGGLLEFDDTTFHWYQSPAGEGDCYEGQYAVLPGVKTASGFRLADGAGTTDQPVTYYSVVQHYTVDHLGGVPTPAERHGLLYIQLLSPDEARVYDHRTATEALARRIA